MSAVGAPGAAPVTEPTADGLRLDAEGLVALCDRFVTTEYASLTKDLTPITVPVTPYAGDGTLDVSTGLSYPVKADRARRDPRVALSFSDPLASGLDDPPVVVVKGLATVVDSDLVETSARYLRRGTERFPEVAARTPAFAARRMAWYWARIWIQVTPVEVLWWPGGDLDAAPGTRRVGPAVAPPSDPGPRGPAPRGSARPQPWETRADGAVARFGAPVLTVVDADGWPLPLRCRAVHRTPDGFTVTPPAGVAIPDGPACLTFHRHDPRMEHQENFSLVGTATVRGGEVDVRVDRSLVDWSIPAGRLRGPIDFMSKGRRLRSRLEAEAARRGLRVPTYDEVRADR